MMTAIAPFSLSYIFYSKRDFNGKLPFKNGGIIDLERNYYGFGSSLDFSKEKNQFKHKTKPNTIPLIQAATDILGLPFKEINYGINFIPKKRPLRKKYICIGPQATSGCKEWPREHWLKLANLLTKEGYKVVSLSLHGFEGKNIKSKSNLPWDNLFNYLYHADLFIGLGSGLSWVNWALNKHTFMINGFADKNHEFTNNITRIQNLDVCNGCWNEEKFTFDPGNWDWCPENEGTELQHICQKSITPERVYKEVKQYLI